MSQVLLIPGIIDIEYHLDAQIEPAIQLGPICLSAVLENHDISTHVDDLGFAAVIENIRGNKFIGFALNRILMNKSNIIGFSVCSTNLPSALMLAEQIKRHDPKRIIIFGGPGVIDNTYYLLDKYPYIDLLVRFEADKIIVPIITTLIEYGFNSTNRLECIPGLTFRKGAKIVETDDPTPIIDLNTLPYPDYRQYLKVIESYRQRFGGSPSIPIDSGRGCWGKCIFCSTTNYFKKVTYKSPERILSEIQFIKNIFGEKNSKRCAFLHDHFTASLKHVKEISNAINIANLDVTFTVASRGDVLNKNTLQYLKKMKTEKILIGLETASETMQRKIKKNINISKALPNILAASKDIQVQVNFLWGFPNENKIEVFENWNALINFSKTENVKICTGLFCPMPGSTIVRELPSDKLKCDGYIPEILDFNNIPGAWSIIKSDPKLFSPYWYYENNNGINREFYIFLSLTSQVFEKYPLIGSLLLENESMINIAFKIWMNSTIKNEFTGDVENPFYIRKYLGKAVGYILLFFDELIRRVNLDYQDQSLFNSVLANAVLIYEVCAYLVMQHQNSYCLWTFDFDVAAWSKGDKSALSNSKKTILLSMNPKYSETGFQGLYWNKKVDIFLQENDIVNVYDLLSDFEKNLFHKVTAKLEK